MLSKTFYFDENNKKPNRKFKDHANFEIIIELVLGDLKCIAV